MFNKNSTSWFNYWCINVTVLLLSFVLSGFSQSSPSDRQILKTTTLQGTIRFEMGGNAVSGIITLLKSDSSLLRATSSDSTGTFYLKNVVPGSYILQASYVGWQSVKRPVIVSDTATTPPVHLILGATALKLGEVSVKEKRPVFEILADRLVLNVESNPVFGGGNAFDALGRAPRVTTDAVAKTIAVDGKTGLILYQNGHQLYLPPDQITSYLQGLPASVISRIEILTNPSAQYDAGSSGIILLYTKGINKEGLTGEIALSGGAGRYPKGNGSMNLAFQTANAQGTFLYAPSYRPTYFSWRSDQYLAALPWQTAGFAHSDEFNRIDNMAHLLRTAWDWKVAKRLTIGTVLQFTHTVETDYPTSAITYQLASEGTPTKIDAKTQLSQRVNNLAGNLNARRQFKNAKSVLSADIDVARFTVGSASSANFLQTLPQLHQPEYVQIRYPNQVQIRTAKIDYKTPFLKKGQVESGIKYSWITMTNMPNVETYTPYFKSLISLLSNSYQYREQTKSIYTNLAYNVKNWSLQAGVRLEHTDYKGISGYTIAINRSYINLFPSLNVQFTSEGKNQYSISLNRRIIRPSFDLLNPAFVFYDPLTLYSGNPLLVPQLTTTIQGTYSTPRRISLTLVYSNSKNRIAEVVYRIDSLSPTTLDYSLNFDWERRLAATLSVPLKVTKGWQMQGVITAANSQFYSTFKGVPFLNEQSTAIIRVNNTVTWKKWSANVNGTYRGLAVVGFMIYDPIWFVDLGLQRPLGGNSTVKVTATDIFHTLLIRNYGEYLNTNISFRHKYESQQFLLTYSYRFGNRKAKSIEQRSFGSDTEQERLGTKRN